jgi:hypothetical protein
MIKEFKNYQCELSGSMVIVRKDGQMIKAIEVNPLNAVERWESLCVQVQRLASPSPILVK